MAANESEEKAHTKQIEAAINRALGIFLTFFGSVVLFAIFFTTTVVGQLVNLTVGFILTSIGLGMMWRARQRGK